LGKFRFIKYTIAAVVQPSKITVDFVCSQDNNGVAAAATTAHTEVISRCSTDYLPLTLHVTVDAGCLITWQRCHGNLCTRTETRIVYQFQYAHKVCFGVLLRLD
jgi:hypothetical protein